MIIYYEIDYAKTLDEVNYIGKDHTYEVIVTFRIVNDDQFAAYREIRDSLKDIPYYSKIGYPLP